MRPSGRLLPWWPLWAGAASLAWLLPDHRLPWTAFQGEWWFATVLVAVALILTFRMPLRAVWTRQTIAVWMPLAILLLQWSCGLIASVGTAWIAGAYLAAWAAAVRLGQSWQAQGDGEVADFVFMAALIASTASVGLQFYQLLHGEWAGPWINLSVGRFEANVAQANNLATLQVLSLPGLLWLCSRGHIRQGLALPIGLLILSGVVLTGSRTGTLLVCLFCAGYLAGARWIKELPKYGRVVAAMVVLFAMLIWTWPTLYSFLEGGQQVDVVVQGRSVASDARLGIWQVAIQAVQARPWLGYGWGQIPAAQLMGPVPSLALGLFSSSHNLILDLALWVGVPAGALILLSLAGCLWSALSQMASFRGWCTAVVLCGMLTHAMLELPLQYTYFLLPFGLLLGSLLPFDLRPISQAWQRGAMLVPVLLFVMALWVIGADYLKVEAAQTILRLESVGARTNASEDTRLPPLRVLLQFEDFFQLSRLEPMNGYSDEQLLAMEVAVATTPSDDLIYRLAASLALNGHTERARRWMVNLCRAKPEASCQQAAINWAAQGFDRQSGLAWSGAARP